MAPASANGSADIAQSNQELVGTKRKWNAKRLIIAGSLTIAVAIIIALLVILLRRDDNPESNELNQSTTTSSTTWSTSTEALPTSTSTGPTPTRPLTITLEDILEHNFDAKPFNGTWLSDNEILFNDYMGDVMLHNVENGTTQSLYVIQEETILQGDSFRISPDRQYVLVSREIRPYFRHSFDAIYDIVDIKTNRIYPLNVKNERARILLVSWAPTGNALAFVYRNNIYYKASVGADEQQLTFDGNEYGVYNGIPDWVYEEEVFASNVAMEFSPDAQQLWFVKFNDIQTPFVHVPVYGPPGNLDFQYTKLLPIRYPKAGAPNPKVTLHVYNLATNETHEQAAPSVLLSQDHVIATVAWANERQVVAVWMNRIQNQAYVNVCERDACKMINEIISKSGWVDLFVPPLFNKDGSQMVVIMSQEQGGDGDYRHITMIDINTGASRPVTRGKFVVQKILRWRHADDMIFYMANTEAHSEVRHLFSIAATVASGNATAHCLSCDRVKIDGTTQTYFSAAMSTNGSFVALSAQGPAVPSSSFYAVDNQGTTLKSISDWETNESVRERLAQRLSTITRTFTATLADNFTAKVKLYMPADFDASGRTKYPLLVDVYAGPDTAKFIDKWEMDWGTYMTANKSIIYAQIDGRGSGLRGDRIMHAIYRKLGTVEIVDQITATEQMQAELPFVDRRRTGIWGWSYGGFASTMALARDAGNVFACAAAVNPVTDWLYYDSIYTERFMGLPIATDNKVGYDNARASTLAANFKGRQYLLAFGTKDDNVHEQQSLVFSKALERKDVLFKQITYADEHHALSNVRPHLYHSLGKFFDDCFTAAGAAA